MKILILSHAQYITVALPKIIEFAETLSGMGHEITLMVTHKTNILKAESFTHNGVHYLLSPSILPGKFRHGADFYDALRRILLTRKMVFDIIHAIDSRPSVILPALFLQRKHNTPLVLEWSDWFGKGGTIQERSGKLYAATVGKFESFFEERFRLRADGATAISQLLHKRLTDMGFDESLIHIHRMGCNLERFAGYDKQSSRKHLKIEDDKIIFSYFGRILPNDQALLLSAFDIFKKAVNLNVHLYFIGNVKHPDGNIPEGVEYKGLVPNDDYDHYLSATDVCLLPLKLTLANLARWPSKFVDYLAAGKPVVATNVSDFEAIFQENEIGILCNSDKDFDFAEAMVHIIDKRHDWNQLGQNGKKYAKENLSWPILTQSILQFYHKIISQKNSRQLPLFP